MSTLRTNALEGVDAKNSITIVAGAGNITTTNVQEGLCKSWVNFDGTAGSISNADNFNSSGLTDHGTGNYTASWTNALSSANYSVSGIGGDNSVSSPIGMFIENSTPSTDSFKFFCTNASASVTDFKYVSILAHGDLA